MAHGMTAAGLAAGLCLISIAWAHADAREADATPSTLFYSAEEDLASIERRVTSLERVHPRRPADAERVNRIALPFDVVDGDQNPIVHFANDEKVRGFELRAVTGQPMVIASAVKSGGYIKVQSLDETSAAILGTYDKTAFATLRTNRTPIGAFAIDTDGKALLTLDNHDGQSVVVLTEGSASAGLLQLRDAKGVDNVEAGTIAAGVGEVRAGPTTECVISEGLRVPSCIRGHRK